MFKGTFKKSSTFSTVIDVIKDFITDGNLKFHGSGIGMNSIDANHICLCIFNISKNLFSDFLCDELVRIGVNINSLSKILKCSFNKETLTIYLEDCESSQLQLQFGEKPTAIFEINLIALDIEEKDLSHLEYDNMVCIKFEKFASIIKDLQIIGETTVITCEHNKLVFSTEGDMGNLNIELQEEDIKEITINEKYSEMFSLKYLNSFIKGSGLNEYITIYFKKETPLMFDISLEMDDESYLRFFLAPKIQ